MQRDRLRPPNLLGALLLALGCVPRIIVVAERPTRLGPAAVVLTAPEPLEAKPPTRQVCVYMDSARARPEPPISIVLLTAAGERDTLGVEYYSAQRPGAPSVLQDAPGQVCYWDHGAQEGRSYNAVELRAPDTLTVSRVDWFSGQRRVF